MEGKVTILVDEMVLPWDLKAAVAPSLLFEGICLPEVPLLAVQSCSLVDKTSLHHLLPFQLLSQLLCVMQ